MFDETLIEPVCQASFLRYTNAESDGKNRLLFSNPASKTDRDRVTVRLSYDEGETWPVSKLLYKGKSDYSSLAVLPDRTNACLYERGVGHYRENLYFSRFTLGWFTDGTDQLP